MPRVVGSKSLATAANTSRHGPDALRANRGTPAIRHPDWLRQPKGHEMADDPESGPGDTGNPDAEPGCAALIRVTKRGPLPRCLAQRSIEKYLAS